MDPEKFFIQAFVYLVAAVVSVPIAKRLGLGSVLGYLLAGVIIGPFGLRLTGEQGGDVMHFAEFGVVLMLFLVGLELQPALLWKLRGPILGMGGLQVVATAGAVGLLGLALGQSFSTSLAVGLILAMSSTAIVLQSLQEKGLLKTPAGQSSFSVLLFQDIAVIPILAFLPLLALAPAAFTPGTGDGHAAGANALPGWQQALLICGAVAGIILAGRFLVRPVFRFIAESKLREIFTAAALLLVIGIALLMQKVGLSAALGTFLAGVVLANSEYRHELESDIEPFKGLLLGLFFISVGAGINFTLMRDQPGLIAGLVFALIAVKFIVLLGLGKAFKLGTAPSLLFAFALAQGGEFAFVLVSFALQKNVLTAAQASPLVATVALSMALTPLLFIINEKLVQPRFARAKGSAREPDTIDAGENPVIIAGFGRFGHIVGRLLKANGVGATVLDLDGEQIDLLRRLGLKVFYGDASRLDLLHAAGASRAKLFVLAIDDERKGLELVDTIRKHFPHLTILARATGRAHAYELMHRGVEHVYRETLGSSLDLGMEALRLLGFRAYQAQRAVRELKKHDEQAVRDLAAYWGDEKAYVSQARLRIEQFEQAMQNDQGAGNAKTDQRLGTIAHRRRVARLTTRRSNARRSEPPYIGCCE